jgi:hypothetical protein
LSLINTFIGTTIYQFKMSTSIYLNDNDDYFIPLIETSEEDIWRQEKKEVEALDNRLKTKHQKMASNMVSYIYNNLASKPGFEVAPIYYDIPECRVTIRGVGRKRSLMFLIRIDPSNLYYISMSPIHTLEEKRFEETPKDVVDSLINTQICYLAN